jgi:lipopolysaccharide export system permease protein
VASFEKFEDVRISLDRYLGQNLVKMKPEWLTYGALRAEQARHAASTPPPEKRSAHAREQMQFSLIVQEKFNLSLAVFSFALLGVPLGIKVSRRETSANLGLALLLVLGFYILTATVKSLDKKPQLRPDLLIWLPNLLCIGLGLWLFRRVERR